ncbi:MAG: glycosyltransferase, partial [Methylobacter sp.]
FRTVHFDETLGAYEDWDFLAQLALAGYRFAHVDEVTCEYRVYAEGESISLEQYHDKKGYFDWENQVHARIAGQFNAAHLKTLAGIVTRLEESERGLETRLSKAVQAIAGLEAQLKEKDGWQDLLKRALAAIGIDKVGRRGLAQLIGQSLPAETLFSLIVPVYNTPADVLAEALGAIIGQSYPGWELCLVDDASTDSSTLDILNKIENTLQHRGKLRLMRRAEQGGIVAASNDALALARAPYVAFIDHDDILHEDALLEIALVLKQERAYKLIYTDSTMVDLAGKLLHVNRKPDWSPETLLHMNYINHLTVVQRELVIQLGGLRQNYEGSQDWDLLLRIAGNLNISEVRHIRTPLYAWRAAEQSLAYRSSAKPEAFEAGVLAVTAHLQQKGLKQVRCAGNPDGPGLICDWDAAQRKVEIIIPTHNNLDGLKTCINGILTGTDYPLVKISVIANRCSSTEMQAYLGYLADDCQINLIIDDRPFNWAALNNLAASRSNADLLLFMNDDVEIQKSPDWLSLMNRYFELDRIGIVGATLFYANDELQHNGIHTDRVWGADNIHSLGAYGEFSVTRNVSAVTGACLLVSRHVYNEVGGFDERFAVNYNDVDFCLAARRAGYRIVQAAEVKLVHHESISRGVPDTAEKKAQLQQELTLMRDKWGDFLLDPHWAEYEVHAQGTRILHVA